MAISKLILNGTTQMDVTQTTVSANNLLSGYSAVGADGLSVSGSIPTKSAADLSVSGPTVNVPAGYFPSAVSKNVPYGGKPYPEMVFNSATGLLTATNYFASFDGTVGYMSAGSTASSYQLSTQAASTITPTTTSQLAVASSRFTTGSVYVDPIPSAYIIPSGTLSISSNASGLDVTSYASVDVDVETAGIYTASITVTSGANAYIRYNETSYSANGSSFTFHAGDTCVIYVYGRHGGGSIYEYGTYIAGDQSGLAYTYTLPDSNVNFELDSAGSVGYVYISPQIVPTGTVNITSNGTFNVATYYSASVLVTPSLSAATVTPTTSTQVVSTPSGYDGLSQVTVNAIPSAYIIPTGTSNITSNGTFDVTQYASAVVSMTGGNLVAKKLDVNKKIDIVTPDNSTIVGEVPSGSSIRRSGNTKVLTNESSLGDLQINVDYRVVGKIDVTDTLDSENSMYIDEVIRFTSVNQEITINTGLSNVTKVFIAENDNFGYQFNTGGASISATCTVDYFLVLVEESSAYDGLSYVLVKDGGFQDLVTRRYSGIYSTSAISYVGSYAFYSCSLLTGISLPNVSRVWPNAFAYCLSLSSLYIPEVTELSAYAFTSCISLSLDINSSNFPKLTLIGGYAFQGTMVSYISHSASRVEAGVFQYCHSLREANLTSVSYAASSIFRNCENLSVVSFPEALSIYSSAFTQTGLSRVTSAEFPKVEGISGYAFASCSQLQYVSLSTVTNISGIGAFGSCQVLSTVSLADLSMIPNSTFTSCYSLETVSFPNVQSIGGYIFLNCWGISTLSFPNLTYISGYAFASCFNLLSLYLLGSSVITLANTNAFVSTPISTYTTSTGGVNGSIYVPASLYDTYRNATNWKTYSARIASV